MRSISTARRVRLRSDFHQLKQAATLKDTLVMMGAFGYPCVVRIGCGLRVAMRPGVRLMLYRPKSKPTIDEVVAFCKVARQAGIMISASRGRWSAFGRFMCVTWCWSAPASVAEVSNL